MRRLCGIATYMMRLNGRLEGRGTPHIHPLNGSQPGGGCRSDNPPRGSSMGAWSIGAPEKLCARFTLPCKVSRWVQEDLLRPFMVGAVSDYHEYSVKPLGMWRSVETETNKRFYRTNGAELPNRRSKKTTWVIPKRYRDYLLVRGWSEMLRASRGAGAGRRGCRHE
jgi:hypothetical protein